MLFLSEKKDGRLKARHCADGSAQREYMQREEVTSPTVNTESTMLTVVIEAEERRDVATCDIPNAFIQTEVEDVDQQGNRTVMKIRGDLLCQLDPSYARFVEQEKQGPVYTFTSRIDLWNDGVGIVVLQEVVRGPERVWIQPVSL
jgi:hypothetical protein